MPSWGQDECGLCDTLTGGIFTYTVQPGDYLIRIGARFGEAALVLARENRLDYGGILMPGRRLVVDNRHIVPARMRDGILINLPQRMLFLFRGGEVAAAYPVGLGKPTWPTPTGGFTVADLQVNKPWKVPKSIQEEMRREGKAVRSEVPPGPDNPLGRHWIGLSIAGYGIHGTIAPASVFHFQSHGCIRLHPDDVAELFGQVHIGTRGSLVYRPVMLALLADGRIFLEVHRDIYNRGIDPWRTVQDLARAHHIDGRLDWSRVREIIRRQDGLAREAGLAPDGGTNKENDSWENPCHRCLTSGSP